MSSTNNPFFILGLTPSASAADVRAAYRSLVKQCHPDQYEDPAEQQAAKEKLVRLNLAYEEALKLTAPRREMPYTHTLSLQDSLILAKKMLNQQNPSSALRQLQRASSRNTQWYALHGDVLMALEQYEQAHESYREAIRQEPDNNEYRKGALAAAVAMKKANTLGGKLKSLFKKR